MRLLSITPSLVLLSVLSVTQALAIPELVTRSGVSTLSNSALNALAPYTEFARAAYCTVTGWTCSEYRALYVVLV